MPDPLCFSSESIELINSNRQVFWLDDFCTPSHSAAAPQWLNVQKVETEKQVIVAFLPELAEGHYSFILQLRG